MNVIKNILLFICFYQAIMVIQIKYADSKKVSVLYKVRRKINETLRENPIRNIDYIKIVFVSLAIYLVIFIAIFSITKMFMFSIILAFPFLIFPYILLKLRVEYNKQKVRKQLPIYAMNLKGKLDTENNIILAIKNTKSDESISSVIKPFVKDIELGLPTYRAFEKLKNTVMIREFADLISSFQICSMHGGNFSKILSIYSRQLSEKLALEEKEKEKIRSSILTLAIMVGLNVFLLFGYIFSNVEFANIFRNSLLGKIIVDVNALSLIACAYFLFKIYKEN